MIRWTIPNIFASPPNFKRKFRNPNLPSFFPLDLQNSFTTFFHIILSHRSYSISTFNRTNPGLNPYNLTYVYCCAVDLAMISPRPKTANKFHLKFRGNGEFIRFIYLIGQSEAYNGHDFLSDKNSKFHFYQKCLTILPIRRLEENRFSVLNRVNLPKLNNSGTNLLLEPKNLS